MAAAAAVPRPRFQNLRGWNQTQSEIQQERVATNMKVAELKAISTKLVHAEGAALLGLLSELRAQLSTRTRPPVQEALESEIPEALVSCFRRGLEAPAALEAAWVVTNLATGTSAQTAHLLELGLGQVLADGLNHPSMAKWPELCDQLLWALGNMAGDPDVRVRDSLLSMGAVGILGRLFSRMPDFEWNVPSRTQVLRSLTWLLSSLCRGSPAPAFEEVACLIDYFVQVVAGSDDERMLAEALWGLTYLIESAESSSEVTDRVARLLRAGYHPGEVAPEPHPVLAKVVACSGVLGHPQNPLVPPAVRLIGSLLRSCDSVALRQTIDAGALGALRVLLLDGNAPLPLRRDVAWALSNLAAGATEYSQKLMLEPDLWEALLMTVDQGLTKELRVESLWCVLNITKRCFAPAGSSDVAMSGRKPEPRQVLSLIAKTLRKETFDSTLNRALLDVAELALRQGEEGVKLKALKATALVRHAQDIGLLDELEAFQRSGEASTQRKANYMIDTWFGSGTENDAPTPKDLKARAGSNTPSAIAGSKSPGRRAAYQFGA